MKGKSRVLVWAGSEALSRGLVAGLSANPAVADCRVAADLAELEERVAAQRVDTLVYAPWPGSKSAGRARRGPGGGEEPPLRRVVEAARRSVLGHLGHLVLVSSGAVNEPSHRHPGHISEDRRMRPRGNPTARLWLNLEDETRQELAGSETRLTVLRPTSVLVAGGRDYPTQLLERRVAFPVAGFDPPLQLLSLSDLATAVECAVVKSRGGTYNVTPRGVVPLHEALRLAGVRRVALPLLVRRFVRRVWAGLGSKARSSLDPVEYVRYPWTLSGERIRQDLGFVPSRSSAQAVREFTRGDAGSAAEDPDFDDFGLDKAYVARLSRLLYKFLHDSYWRVEWRGLENVPLKGRAVLTGVHRGFMPWDGVMTFYLIVRELRRYPRFLIHPTVVKFPFLAPYMSKIGGVIACQENADTVLGRDGLLGVYPEGIQGAFRAYRDAYKLGRFGRDDYIKMALRNRAPIVPFVTLGSAEIFPILAKLHWRWWKRRSEWPCLPLTPTLGLLPLPSKWHTRFLEPLHIEERYPAEAAGDPEVVHAISKEVRDRVAAALEEMLRRRKSIFYGSVFEEERAAALAEKPA